MYAKDLRESKYEYLIKNRENAEINHLNDSKAFIECSMDDIYENINNYKPNRKRKILIVFADMIADIMANKKFQSLIKDMFIRCRKYFTCFYHSVLFFCSKRCKTKFNTLSDYEN